MLVGGSQHWLPAGWPTYRLKTEDEYARATQTKPLIGKQYFKHLGNLDPNSPIRLDDVILHYPMNDTISFEQQEAEKTKRYSLVDFLEVSHFVAQCSPIKALQCFVVSYTFCVVSLRSAETLRQSSNLFLV